MFEMNEKHLQRIKLFKILFAVIISIGSIYSLYYYFVGSRHVTTDNAYVAAEIAQVTPAVAGIVKTIYFNDTDTVKEGDILVILDDTDLRLSLSKAKANLAMAEADLERRKLDYTRRTKLSSTGSVSSEEVTVSANAFKSAQAAFDIAKVGVEQAKIDLERATVRSPIDGVVAKRFVQLGQRIQIGAPMMSIVPLNSLHVDANFKEVQLNKVRIGQPVEIYADIYGTSVTYHGKVLGIAGGTGSAFAVIPAQNATGNWIKVVQRLPVRISLDPEELKAHPLQVGLSMYVDINISTEK